MSTIGLRLRSTAARTPEREGGVPATPIGQDDGSARRCLRPYVTAGVVLAGAGLIAATPIAPRPPTTTMPIVQLTGSDSLQAVIDQLQSAQQEVYNFNSGLPFVTPFDLTRLPNYVHQVPHFMLNILLGEEASNNFNDITMPRYPYQWDANAANPEGGGTGGNPDDVYRFIPIEPGRTYTATINPGPASADYTFTGTSGDQVTHDIDTVPGTSVDLSSYTPNPDGTYTITMSSTSQPGNWYNTSGVEEVVVRPINTGDWGLPANTISIQEEGVSTYTLPVLSQSEISSMLSTIATYLPAVNQYGSYLGSIEPFAKIPDNTFIPIKPFNQTLPGGALQAGTLQAASYSHFSIDDDQALIVKVPDLDANSIGFATLDTWIQPSTRLTDQGSLSSSQAFQEPDGFTYYVVSDQDPGVQNWIATSGLTEGSLLVRYQGYSADADLNQPIQTDVVNIDDVRSALPADMPTVTAAERAADLQVRLLEHGYMIDRDNDMSWVTMNLEDEQVKTALGGASQFDKIFGSQQDVPSVLDRLTSPALMPNLDTVAHDIFTNPAGSLSAIVNNFPLLVKDIELPLVLAALRLDMFLGHAPEAGTLETILNQTFTDPTTSITAGILNARDDLAVSIMNAYGYSPLSANDFTSAWDELVQFEQSVSQMLSGGFSYLLNLGDTTAVSDAADIASLGADLAPSGSALPLDLVP